MRITYIHQYFKTPQAAGGTRSYELARRLVARGHEVNMVTSDTSPEDRTSNWYQTEEAGIKVHWLPNEYSNHMSYSRRIRAFLRFAARACTKAASLPADVIFATSTPLTIAIPAIYAARRRRVPMVFEVRDLWPEAPIAVGALQNPLLIRCARWLERWAYKNATYVVALAPRFREGVVACGYPRSRVKVIFNGADVAVFDVQQQQSCLPPELVGLPTICYTGTIGLVNEVHRIVDIAERTRHHSDLVFVVAGDGREAASLTAYAQERGVLGLNFVMLGQLPKAAIPELLARATAAIGTASADPRLHPDAMNKIADYLAAGKPIFCAFEGWLSSLVCDQGAGVYLPRDPDLAAQILLEHINNQEWLSGASEAARELAKTKFNYDLLVEDLEEVLEAAVCEWHQKNGG